VQFVRRALGARELPQQGLGGVLGDLAQRGAREAELSEGLQRRGRELAPAVLCRVLTQST